ncbi:MAG: alpha/beta hydrolase [Planctomycetota bacterium]
MHLFSRRIVAPTFACLLVVSGCGTDFSSLDELLLKSARLIGPVQADHGLEYEEVAFPTDDGSQLVGWFVPALSGAGRATAVIHTGMQGNIEEYLLTLPWWAENDFNVFVYDWRGFGNSEGLRRFGYFEADTIAAIEYLKTRPEPGADAIIHFGVSLGFAPALAAAARFPDETIGVVVFGAYEPARLPTDYLVTQLTPLLAPLGDIAGFFFGGWSTPFLAPSSHIDGVRAPILAVILEDDVIVPPEAQLALFERYPEPKEVLHTFGGHLRSHKKDPNLGPGIIAWCERLDGLPAAQ